MSIKERYELIEERLCLACERSGRKRSEVKLIAVTKTRTAEEINEALALGITHIGENRVQELLSKIDLIKGNPMVHLIGRLQTNKVKYIFDKVDLIQSLDRIELAQELEKTAIKHNLQPFKTLIEVNIGGESTKSGISPDNLINFLDNLRNFRYIKPIGLMTVAPADADDTRQNTLFGQMYKLLQAGRDAIGNDFCELSMGMSRDFENAVQHGSTMVRLGTALFGERNYNI